MSLLGISSFYFNTTISIQRRTNTTDSVGDYTEIWNDLITGLKATIQPLRITEKKYLPQGKEYQADNKAYVPATIQTELIKEGDRVYDTQKDLIYTIKGVEIFKVAKQNIATNHHVKLYLEINKKPNA